MKTLNNKKSIILGIFLVLVLFLTSILSFGSTTHAKAEETSSETIQNVNQYLLVMDNSLTSDGSFSDMVYFSTSEKFGEGATRVYLEIQVLSLIGACPRIMHGSVFCSDFGSSYNSWGIGATSTHLVTGRKFLLEFCLDTYSSSLYYYKDIDSTWAYLVPTKTIFPEGVPNEFSIYHLFGAKVYSSSSAESKAFQLVLSVKSYDDLGNDLGVTTNYGTVSTFNSENSETPIEKNKATKNNDWTRILKLSLSVIVPILLVLFVYKLIKKRKNKGGY